MEKEKINSREQALVEDIEQLVVNIYNCPEASLQQSQELQNEQNELYNLRENRLLKTIDYKRAEWMEKGEKCSKLFLNL